MSIIPLVGGTLLMIGSVMCGAADLPIDSRGKLTLTLPRQPAENEMLVIKIWVGAISRGTKIVVRATDQEIAGTIVPFGIRPGQKAGMHIIPVTAKAVGDKTVSLRFEILERGARAPRVPTRLEIEDAKLAFIPVLQHPAKGKL